MDLKVIAEASKQYQLSKRFWGLSFLIDENILFDTFSDPSTLKRNMMKFNIGPKQIDHVVLSHEHWDHINGLWWFLRQNSNARVYICNRFSQQFREKISQFSVKVVEVTETTKIKENIFSTGEIPGIHKNKTLYEQSLVVRFPKGNILITGCSHPGISKIMEVAQKKISGDIKIIIGGLHLNNLTQDELEEYIQKYDFLKKVRKIAACHCTGNLAIQVFTKHFPEKVVPLETGTVYNLNSISDEL